MEFLISANTDIGLTKSINQDSLSVKVMNTAQGQMAFAVLCDGMGGFSEGEYASAKMIEAFDRWIYEEFSELCENFLEDKIIEAQWKEIIRVQNQKLLSYGETRGIRLGTTVVVMLLTQDRYYILNVGDSRAYELSEDIRQITRDHSFIARAVSLGKMTEEEAQKDSRRNALWQCVGASKEVYPDLFCGDIKENTVFLLCSDGFRHVISAREIYHYLQPDRNLDEEMLDRNTLALIELNKERQEKDNISAIAVKVIE